MPLPLRQGYPLNKQVPPAAYGNSELMKIPNFLHLSPVAIREQCAALKKFCTDWPTDLELDEKTEKMFPLEVCVLSYALNIHYINCVSNAMILGDYVGLLP